MIVIMVARMVMTLSTKVRRRYLKRTTALAMIYIYLAMRGMVEEVGGRIFDTSSKKTTIESKTDMIRVIFSVESVGR